MHCLGAREGLTRPHGARPGPALPSPPLPSHPVLPPAPPAGAPAPRPPAAPGHVSLSLSGPLLLPFSCLEPSSDVSVLLGFQVTARLSLPPEAPFQVTRSEVDAPCCPSPSFSTSFFIALLEHNDSAHLYLCTCFLSFVPWEMMSSSGRGLHRPPALVRAGPGRPSGPARCGREAS